MSIDVLNQHPLNQAALRRLEKAGVGTMSGLVHVFTLAYAGLPDDLDPFSPEGKIMMDWSAGKNLQAAALEALEEALSPEEIENLALPDVAERIVGTLHAEQARGDDW